MSSSDFLGQLAYLIKRCKLTPAQYEIIWPDMDEKNRKWWESKMKAIIGWVNHGN